MIKANQHRGQCLHLSRIPFSRAVHPPIPPLLEVQAAPGSVGRPNPHTPSRGMELKQKRGTVGEDWGGWGECACVCARACMQAHTGPQRLPLLLQGQIDSMYNPCSRTPGGSQGRQNPCFAPFLSCFPCSHSPESTPSINHLKKHLCLGLCL